MSHHDDIDRLLAICMKHRKEHVRETASFHARRVKDERRTIRERALDLNTLKKMAADVEEELKLNPLPKNRPAKFEAPKG